jgi:CheY-like chemotaxis protein
VTKRATVLVIDPLEETRQVLQTVLPRRGLRIVTARRADEGLRLARVHHPDLIVLDGDELGGDESGGDALESSGPRASQSTQPNHSKALRAALAGDADEQTPVLILSSTKLPAGGDRALHLRKPYHYGPLVHKIEALLAERFATRRAG